MADAATIVAGGELHGGRRHDLHQVVDDHVADRPDRVVEVAAVLDPEALGHGDLDALDVVAVPERLEHPVREARVEDLLESHLPQEVVDSAQLRLVDVLVQLVGQRAGGCQVMAERLLHHDPCAAGQPGPGESAHHHAEERRWDLQVEHGVTGPVDRLRDALVGAFVGEVALHVGEPLGEPGERIGVQLLAEGDDGVVRALHEPLLRPVVDRNTDDGALQQTPDLEPV